MNNKELEILEESIRAYLAQDEMEYFEGCQFMPPIHQQEEG